MKTIGDTKDSSVEWLIERIYRFFYYGDSTGDSGDSIGDTATNQLYWAVQTQQVGLFLSLSENPPLFLTRLITRQ